MTRLSVHSLKFSTRPESSCAYETSTISEDAYQRGSVLTIGAFDGLHLGHQAIISHVTQLAADYECPAVALTLEPLPREYFLGGKAPARLMNLREKIEGFKRCGVDELLIARFNHALRSVNAEDFVLDLIVKQRKTRHIVIGDDFRFGLNGEGDFALLQKLGEKHNFKVEATQSITQDIQSQETRVSSTEIRKLLALGDFENVQRLLGQPFSMSGKIIKGRQLGRTIGAPTANIAVKRRKSPVAGVYAVMATVNGQHLPAIANVGTRPTVNDDLTAVLEVHLLNFSGDLYGQRMQVRFDRHLREEKKFESVDQLKNQIHQDIALAKEIYGQ